MSLEQSIAELSAAIRELVSQINQGVAQPKTETKKKETKKKAQPKTEAPKTEEVKPEPVAEVKVEEPKPEPDVASAVPSTIDDMRKVLLPIIQQHTPAPVSTALTTLGAATLSELPVEKYGELLTMVRAATEG